MPQVEVSVPGYRRAQGGHVEYEVVIEGRRVWERYSRMRELDKGLRTLKVQLSSEFPEKGGWFKKHDSLFLEERRRQLERYLLAVFG